MVKIKVDILVVEFDGDEMICIIWQMIKDKLILFYFDIDLKYYDFLVIKCDEMDDQIIVEVVEVIKYYGVGVKCVIIMLDEVCVEEFDFKKMWCFLNGIICNIFGGVVFCELIVIFNVLCLVLGWQQLMVIGCYVFGDQYCVIDFFVDKLGKLIMIFVLEDGFELIICEVFDFLSFGVVMGMYNLDESIKDFVCVSMNYGLQCGWLVYLFIKNMILKVYDGCFKDIFQDIFDVEFKDVFQVKGIFYEYCLIDDMVVVVMKWFGGFVWVCKNYDGDVQFDIVV